MSPRRPTEACFKFSFFILSRRRFRHPIGAFYFYYIISYSCCIWITYLRASWILFCDWRYDHEIFQSMIIFHYVIPEFIMFVSTFKVLTDLSLAIVLARFLAWRGALRWQRRNLRNEDSNLAKIGVIQVSCSCGKWSPIDVDDRQTASAINH